MINFGDIFDAAIKDTVNDVLIKGEIPDITLSETDNLGEVVEKLCILHIRMWMLEDVAQEATTDEELGSLKRKIDICFKQKRPRLVQAINRQVSDAIVNNTSLVEDSVKLYKGVPSLRLIILEKLLKNYAFYTFVHGCWRMLHKKRLLMKSWEH